MAKITNLNTNPPDPEFQKILNEPKVVKIAELGVALADPNITTTAKENFIIIGRLMGWLTKEESDTLMKYINNIMQFAEFVNDDSER
jgi:ABC-type polysaccharide/polyol phosphate transport system ATPase subunit